MAIVIKEIKVISTVENTKKESSCDLDSPEVIRKLKKIIKDEQRNRFFDKPLKQER